MSEEDQALLEENFRAYINGFSKNVDDIIEHFNYRATIGTMVKNNRLAPILNQYKELAPGSDQLSGREEEVCRQIERRNNECNDVKAAIESQIDTLVAYRKSLIHECVTGQRRISEADVRQANAAESCELSNH